MARVADQRRPQAHWRHVRDARPGHAAARLFRRDHDAHAAGDRGRRCAGIPASGSLRPDLFGARHDHDLFRRDAARHRTDELCRAVAARRARRRLSGAQFGQLLADRDGRPADQCVARHRHFRAHRLDGLSAALGARFFARCRRRLLPLVIADLGHRHVADRHQFRDHDSQIARARHDLFPHAGVLLDGARRKSADRRRVPGPDRDLPDAAARPLPRHAFLHQRCRRQPDDVRQSVLGVGPSRSLHTDPAGIRHLFRSRRDLFRQGAVQLPLDGLGDARDLHPLFHGLAASLFHHGRGRQCQRFLRDHVVDHRGADGRQSLQLAVHDVPRPDRVSRRRCCLQSASSSRLSSAA